ncbi:MAG TPA: ABC transporter permease [Thermoanaerobaculia bacterium]|nr:ABC transporter permease [Thermoanaerobaculia bacterium]
MDDRTLRQRGRGRSPLDPEPQAEVDSELAFHLEQRIQDYVARGMDPAAARAAALERFGDLNGVRQECTQLLAADRRAADRRDWFGDLRQDLWYGVRSALHAPLFSLLAIVTLALGIGANAAVFGVVKSVLLDALPYADPDRLVRAYAQGRDESFGRSGLSAGAVTDIAERQRSFSRLTYFSPFTEDVAYAAESGPLATKGALVGPGFFETLDVPPALGRPLAAADAVTDAPRVVMLSYAAWQRLFGGDPGVIGRSISLNAATREVVGVLPRTFVAPMGEAEFWFPLDIGPALRDPIRIRRQHWLGLIGRLVPGATVEGAERELAAIVADMEREHPPDAFNVTVDALPLRDDMAGETRTPLLILMASAGLVLLITCANLAGALLSRTLSRRKELAMRSALGAGQSRLVRQLLTESTVLALAGGAAGLVLAGIGLAVLRGLALPALPPHAELALDGGAVVITLLVTLLTGLAFGVAPALSAARSDPQGALRDESRGGSEGLRSRRLRGALVAGQIALSISLLAGAGLLARSLWAMTTAPLGFDPEGVLTVQVQLPWRIYDSEEKVARFFDQLEERLRAQPGVTAVASASEPPRPMMNNNGLAIEGVTWPQGEGIPFIACASVSNDYFRTMAIPLLRGRNFQPTDRLGGPPVVVISESMARRYWPAGGELGAHVRLGPNTEAPWSEVVGVVADVRNDPTQPQPEPMTYFAMNQDPWGSRVLMLRTAGEPLALVRAVERELAALDRTIPIQRAVPLPTMLAEGLAGRRLPVVLMAAFGALALLLASVGVYAMFASMAAARQQEFGIRVALGSSRRAIAGLVLRQGGVWMAAGLAAGALGVVAVARLLRNLLYGVPPFDPVALSAAALALLLCATIALLLPVRRATRVDPITVLR